jgi:hypothetical protein
MDPDEIPEEIVDQRIINAEAYAERPHVSPGCRTPEEFVTFD